MKTAAFTRTITCGLALAISSIAAAQTPAAPGKRLYCWNENGKRTCSDALPPEQAGSARTEISARSGRVVDQVERALNAQERAAAAETQRQAQQVADQETAAIRRDLAMVESYATEADLRRAFGERIALVDESIKTSVLSEANLRRGLVDLLSQAANLELSEKPVAKPLQEKIRTLHGELERQRVLLAQQRADRAALGGDLGAALQRYRNLRAAAVPAA